MTVQDHRTASGWSFGPFHLSAETMQLTRDGRPVPLGSRAIRILLALLERQGEVVTVEELLKEVWPTIFVEPVTMRGHLHALRKALGDGRRETRYIINEMGRGYRFVAPVVSGRAQAVGANPGALSNEVIGRETEIEQLCADLLRQRLVTLVGPGGVGKTTVALAVAKRFRDSNRGEVRFIDLSSLNEAPFVSSAIASPLGLSLPSEDGGDALARALPTRRLLLILDNCEHLVTAVADVAEALWRGAPGVTLLCTSREPLRARGERLHRLAGLSLPESDETSPEAALTYGGVRLFCERLAKSRPGFQLTPESVALVSKICRRLDGLPLALELAASSLPSFSLADYLAHLDGDLALLARGRRAAPQRHQTMKATLEWSHALLSPEERMLFRRLSVFRSGFGLDRAIGVCVCPALPREKVVECLDALVAKSLVQADITGERTVYRLLETTKSLGREKLLLAGEAAALRRLHALMLQAELGQAAVDWRALDADCWLARYGPLIDDIRAALDWAFGPEGEPDIGVRLTALTGSLAFACSLLPEFRGRHERALAVVEDRGTDPVTELRLRAHLCRLISYTGGPHERARGLAARALEIADALGVDAHRAEAMGAFWGLGLTTADFGAMDRVFGAMQSLAARSSDDIAGRFADRLGGLTHALSGDLRRARHIFDLGRDLPDGSVVVPGYHVPLFLDRMLVAAIIEARVAFLQGDIGCALDRAEDAVETTSQMDHLIPLLVVLSLVAIPTAFWLGDLDRVGVLIRQLRHHVERHSAVYFRSQWVRGYECALRLLQGADASESVSDGLHKLVHDHLCTLHPGFVTPEALARAQAGRAGWATAEILRIGGLRQLQEGASRAGEATLKDALRLSRNQGARFWEMRVALDLAAYFAVTGRRAEGIALLAPLAERFASQPATRDLERARVFLDG
ncbi:MAG: winged helix-turn-helix domain-containing protein [Pseudomonadota bacterium]